MLTGWDWPFGPRIVQEEVPVWFLEEELVTCWAHLVELGKF